MGLSRLPCGKGYAFPAGTITTSEAAPRWCRRDLRSRQFARAGETPAFRPKADFQSDNLTTNAACLHYGRALTTSPKNQPLPERYLDVSAKSLLLQRNLSALCISRYGIACARHEYEAPDSNEQLRLVPTRQEALEEGVGNAS